MRNWSELISDAWKDLLTTTPLAREFRSKLLSVELTLPFRVGLRAADNAPCLLIFAPAPTTSLFELSGMRLYNSADPAGPLLVLSLEDESRRDLFLTICSDVIAITAAEEQHSAATKIFFSRLDAWRQFLKDRREGLPRNEVVGLIGELLFLEQLLKFSQDALDTWQAPSSGLHDFIIGGNAVEVKTSSGISSVIYIATLDQLETSGLSSLTLLSIRLVESISGYSLGDLVLEITQRLDGEARRLEFKNLLIRRGLLPNDDIALASPRVTIKAMEPFLVSDEFPRIRRQSVPLPILDAAYTIDLRALAPYSVSLSSVLEACFPGDRT